MSDNFNYAFAKTMGNEGLYSSDPDDPGGETYRGISRKRHPSWQGWAIIDYLKKRYSLTWRRELAASPALGVAVEDFYSREFWDRIAGDTIPSREISAELFDTAVNQGIHYASLFLQKSLNLLNRNATLYPDLVEDGDIGPRTLWCLAAYLKHDTETMLLVWMNVFQGARYAELMRKSPTQEKYARGWAGRVCLGKD